MAEFLTVFCDDSTALSRPLYGALNIYFYPTILTLSGLGNTTIVIAATDAANAFRVCHFGN